MKQIPAITYLAVGIVIACSQSGTCAQGRQSSLAVESLLKNQALARDSPDEFSWNLLAAISAPASKSLQNHFSKDGHRLQSNLVEWETWADDDYTFPCPPDLRKAPTWGRRHSKVHLQDDPFKPTAASASVRTDFIGSGFQQAGSESSDGEEVRRNRPAFETIVKKGLWYREGIKLWAGTNDELKFDPGSIEVKAYWWQISEGDKSKFHWNYGQNGILYGLYGLHIMTNAVEGWTWATWEWSGNSPSGADGAPGRCNWNGCSDSFGSLPNPVPSADSLDYKYPSGALTPKVIQLFKRMGVTDEWRNYRLKGSQTLVNGMPTPRLLGNTQMERLFLDTSSCISCHSKASVLSNGDTDHTGGLIGPFRGPVAPPQPPAAGYHSTDFVWGFIRASSTGAVASSNCHSPH